MIATVTRNIYDSHGRRRIIPGEYVTVRESIDQGYFLVSRKGYEFKLPRRDVKIIQKGTSCQIPYYLTK